MGTAPQSPDTGPDPFAGGEETMRDVRTCEVLHEARADFHNALVEGSVVKDPHFVAQLRQEPTYQMAEFFYLLRAFRLDGEEKIRRYVALHNRHLEALQEDRAKMRRLGLSPTRVRRGRFSPASVPKLIENYRTGDAAIDQSDLSRFLIEVMSPETSRKTAVILTEAGYLERRRSPYQSVLVRSTGALERIFARGLRHVRTALAEDASPVAGSTGAGPGRGRCGTGAKAAVEGAGAAVEGAGVAVESAGAAVEGAGMERQGEPA